MGYTIKYAELASIFTTGPAELSIPGSGTRIINTGFVSDAISENLFSGNDSSIRENITFSYPVFVPPGGNSKTIILLHGLNERSWNKYLAWAYYLSTATGSCVILFPISFHMNRAPVSWKDPRSMMRFLKERILSTGEIRSSTFANIALSSRLSDDPRRFIKAGFRTACDILKLVTQIRDGKHPIILPSGRINIFAYSIGAFLAEIILMADTGGLFSGSKLFMFCGGSVFSGMYGESRHIMDRLASEKLRLYYCHLFEEEIRKQDPVLRRIVYGKLGMAFRSMISFSRFREEREKAIKSLDGRIFTIALAKDRVIPAAVIAGTLGSGSRFEIMDFPYDYIHENPFPVSDTRFASEVDRGFERVFDKASRFLG